MNIVITDDLSINSGDISWQRFADLGHISIFPDGPAALSHGCLQEAEALVIVNWEIDQQILAQCPKLRYIGILSTGYDFVDLKSCRERGVMVTNVPAYGTDSVAQYTLALILELCHHVGEHDAAVKRGDWAKSGRFSFWLQPAIELRGKRLGIIGFGRIGQAVARLGKAFGLEILPYDALIEAGTEVDGCRCLTLDEVLAGSDFLTLHCPLTEATRNLINHKTLSLTKPGLRIINAARGALINSDDLIEALENGQVAAAALDVTEPEPLPDDSPLLRAPNMIITPHMAWATTEARRRIVDLAADNLKAFMNGRPVNVVVA